MKINEIVNYGNLEEAWGDVGADGYSGTVDRAVSKAAGATASGISKAARAVTGAAKRSAKRGIASIAAKAGSNRAQAAKQMQAVASGMLNNFSQFLQQRKLPQTASSLQTYLNALGFKPEHVKITSGGQAWMEQQSPNKQDAEVNRNEIYKSMMDTVQTALNAQALPPSIQKYVK